MISKLMGISYTTRY